MNEEHGISWLNWPGYKPETFNPITGCSPASEGCAYCWAEAFSKRMGWPWGEPILHPERLEEPLHWRKSRCVFVASMTDLWHEETPFAWIDEVFARVGDTLHTGDGRHRWIFLTKRPARMLEWFAHAKRGHSGWFNSRGLLDLGDTIVCVTAENQARADERIPLLLQAPVRLHGVSLEPLLSAINLAAWLPGCIDVPDEVKAMGRAMMSRGRWLNANVSRPNLDWVIAGGESGGPLARSLVERCPSIEISLTTNAEAGAACLGTGWRLKSDRAEWVRSIRDQCQAAGTAFYFKGGGGPHQGATGDLLDGKAYHEWPEVSR